MEQSLVVLQGKVFTVDIQSMFGSTNYGWCLTSLPSDLVLMAAENITSDSIGPVTQRFYFGAVSSAATDVDIHFALMCWSDFTQVVNYHTVHVKIVPSDSAGYLSYSENANLKYGFPCEQINTANAAMPYGMVYSAGHQQNTPFFGNNTGANTPFFGNNTGANTPFFGNNTGANTPFFGNNAGANTPFFGNNTGANTPFFGNNAGANTPFFGAAPLLKYGFPGCR